MSVCPYVFVQTSDREGFSCYNTRHGEPSLLAHDEKLPPWRRCDMIPYPEETRQEALKVFSEKGIRAACERFHVPKSSIYRWRRKALAKSATETMSGKDHITRPNCVQKSGPFGRNGSDGRMTEKMLVSTKHFDCLVNGSMHCGIEAAAHI